MNLNIALSIFIFFTQFGLVQAKSSKDKLRSIAKKYKCEVVKETVSEHQNEKATLGLCKDNSRKYDQYLIFALFDLKSDMASCPEQIGYYTWKNRIKPALEIVVDHPKKASLYWNQNSHQKLKGTVPNKAIRYSYKGHIVFNFICVKNEWFKFWAD